MTRSERPADPRLDSCAEEVQQDGATPADEGDAGADDTAATDHYVEDLLARGEAVPEGTELPPGATHEVLEDDDDPPTVQRRRFSIT